MISIIRLQNIHPIPGLLMIKDSVDRFNIRRHPEKVDRIVSSAWYSMIVGDPFVGGVHQSQERLLLGSKQFLIQG